MELKEYVGTVKEQADMMGRGTRQDIDILAVQHIVASAVKVNDFVHECERQGLDATDVGNSRMVRVTLPEG